jgi:hypothetical protein
MLKLGYKLLSEEHGPLALVRNAQRAEQAGFDFAAISDHFFPWLDEQGHAPLAWSILGALANATRRIAFNAGSVGRADPNIATSWAGAHGCGKSGNGCGLGTMGSTTPSRNISPRS